MSTTTFIHMSDLHLEASDDALYMGIDTMQTLRACLDRARAAGLLPGTSLILSGDLSNHGERESYLRLKALVDDLTAEGVLVLAGIGNHDQRAPFAEVFLGRTGDETLRSCHYAQMVGDVRVIMLDSWIPDSAEGAIDAPQLAWLAGELKHAAPGGTLVVVHHPPISRQAHALPMEMIRNDAELASVLAGTDVVGILSGHIHFPMTSTLAGIPVIAAPATAHLLDPWDRAALRMLAGSGFNVVTVRDGVLEVVTTILPGDQREVANISFAQIAEYLAAAVAKA